MIGVLSPQEFGNDPTLFLVDALLPVEGAVPARLEFAPASPRRPLAGRVAREGLVPQHRRPDLVPERVVRVAREAVLGRDLTHLPQPLPPPPVVPHPTVLLHVHRSRAGFQFNR